MTACLCACLSGCFNGAEGVIETVVVQEGGGLMVGWERRGEGVKRGGRGVHPLFLSPSLRQFGGFTLSCPCVCLSARFDQVPT